MKRILKYILLVSIFTVGVLAEPRSVEEIENVAINFLKEKKVSQNFKRVNGKIKRVKSIDRDSLYINTENNGYRIIKLKPSGWIVISADDIAEPILAYSFDSNLTDRDGVIPPPFKHWMGQVLDAIKKAKEEGNVSEDNKTKKMWNRLSISPEEFDEKKTLKQETDLERGKSFKLNIPYVAPLLKTTWNQGKFYNTLTPTKNGKHTPVGCLAVAMGQIMKYHAWPFRGTNLKREYTKANGLMASANFNTVYNYENMPNKATKNNSGNINIAKILYHAGVSAWMTYDSGTSGAFDKNANAGFKTFFKYSTGGLKKKSDYDNNTWHSILKNNLDNRLPIYYSGNNFGFWTNLLNKVAGHAWVIDGYDYENNKKMYHFNLGWGGAANGYYNIDALNSVGGYNFNNNQNAIFNIQPKGRLHPPSKIYASNDRASFVLLQNFKVTSATKYKIYRTSNANTNVTEKHKRAEVTSNIYLDRDATLNHEYYYYIKACNDDGCSKLSKYGMGIRRQIAPFNIDASDTRSAYILVQNYKVTDATKYKIYRTSAVGTNVTERMKIGETSKSYFADRDALYGHTYYYYVKACNKQNICSGYSGYDTGYRKPLLSAPTSISASDGRYSDKVVVGSYTTNEATYYKIYRASSPAGKPVFRAKTTSSAYTDTHALLGYTYYYYIEACNTKGCSVKSAPDVGYIENIDGVTLLHESTTIHGRYVGLNKIKYYKIRAKGVNVLLYNLSADVDIYIKIGSKPIVYSVSSGDFDYSSVKASTTNDYISTSSSQVEKDIYIGVRGYRSGTYDLRVTKKY